MAKTKVTTKKTDTSKKKPGKTEVSAVDRMLEDNEHLKTAVQQIEAQFGTGSIMALGNDSNQQIRGVSTGSLSLDMALGGSGLPCGRIIEIYGPESSGKTTLALHAIAQAQKTGGICAIVDAEHASDPTWAKKLGVSLDTLLVSQPSSGEEAMQIVQKNVFLSPNVNKNDIEEIAAAESYIGYTLFDKEAEVGKIDNILNPKTNPLFIINEDAENELLIPANEELII